MTICFCENAKKLNGILHYDEAFGISISFKENRKVNDFF